MRRLCLFYKVFHSKVPKYIHSFIPFMRTSEYFQNSFLPCVIREWNKLDPDKWSCLSYDSFHKGRLNFIRPSEHWWPSWYKITCQVEIRFQPLAWAQISTQFWRHFKPVVLLQYWRRNNGALFPTVPVFQWYPISVFQWYPRNPHEWLDSLIAESRQLISGLLYGSDAFDNKKNRKILICTVKLIKGSCRFDDSLF